MNTYVKVTMSIEEKVLLSYIKTSFDHLTKKPQYLKKEVAFHTGVTDQKEVVLPTCKIANLDLLKKTVSVKFKGYKRMFQGKLFAHATGRKRGHSCEFILTIPRYFLR